MTAYMNLIKFMSSDRGEFPYAINFPAPACRCGMLIGLQIGDQRSMASQWTCWRGVCSTMSITMPHQINNQKWACPKSMLRLVNQDDIFTVNTYSGYLQ